MRTRWPEVGAGEVPADGGRASRSGCSCSPPTVWVGQVSAAHHHRRTRGTGRVLAASAYGSSSFPGGVVSPRQVALYLEEHEPSLQATLLSAVETSQSGHVPESAALVRRVVEQAIEACTRIDASKRVEEQPLRRYAVSLAAVALVALLALWLGPAFLRNAMSAMLLLSSNVQAASPYRTRSRRANATVPKGSDQTVTAKLYGFDSEDVVLKVSARLRPVRVASARAQ